MGTKLTIVEPEYLPLLESLGLRRYEDYAGYPAGDVVGRSSTTETVRILVRGGACPVVSYLKRYRYERGEWRPRFRRDKAAIEARNYRILGAECLVPAPVVIAYGSRRCGLRLVEAFILTLGIPEAMPLDAFVAARWPQLQTCQDDELRQYLLAETARIVSQMHAAGFFHIDLQWRNLLVADDGTEWPVVYVIDSARGGERRNQIYAAHGRLRDLSSLAKQAMIKMTARERVRWLRCYFGVVRLSREHHAIVRTILQDRGAKDTDSRA